MWTKYKPSRILGVMLPEAELDNTYFQRLDSLYWFPLPHVLILFPLSEAGLAYIRFPKAGMVKYLISKAALVNAC